jgi:hypothetical protein
MKLPLGWADCPIDTISTAPWNYKKDDEALLEKLKANISRNGLVENLIVRELKDESEKVVGYETVNGNHRLKALQQLGGYDLLHVYNVGPITEGQAKRLAVETNETRFESDKQALDLVLGEILSQAWEDDIRTTLPYTDFELDILTSSNQGLALDDIELSCIEEAPQLNQGNNSAEKLVDEDQRIQYTITLDCDSLEQKTRLLESLKSIGCHVLQTGGHSGGALYHFLNGL